MEKTTVVITNINIPTALGTARALRNLDIQIIGLSSKPESRFCRSRLWNRIITVNDNQEEYLETLSALGKSLSNKAVLFPINDMLVKLVSDRREELQKYFTFVFAKKSVIDLLLDKTTFYEWALKQGFPVPESYIAGSRDELHAILDKIPYPALVKPIFHTERWRRNPEKIYRLYRKKDIEKIPSDLFEASPKLIIQQWIHGRDSNVHFCLFYIDRNGVELGHYTGQKLLQWPVGIGSTAICVGTPNDEVYRLSREVLKVAEFKGLGSLELKQSEDDMKYYIIEPTVGRNDMQSYVAVSGGVNLTLMAFYDAIGEDVKVYKKERKATWIDESGTYHALKYLIKQRNLSLRAILKGMGGKISFASFSIYDPMPFISYFKKGYKCNLL
jgi:D-aspartate ligase